MKTQAKKTETLSRIAKSISPDETASGTPDEVLEIRELSALELSHVGGGGVKDHSV